MRKVGYVVSALLLLAVALGPAFAQPQPFSDVPTNHWAYNAVNSLAEQGLIEGYPDGTFKGKQALTRYEFAQALARLMDRLQAMKGIPGPAGPAGPPGPGAGAGLTPEQQACLDKLCKEFGPELEALRSDLNNLTKRVEDLEAAKPPMPKVTVSGSINWRTGLYGTELGTQDVATSGYPFGQELAVGPGGELLSPYGGINIPGFGTIPISDALKDAFKAADFMTMKTKIGFAAALGENVDANIVLWARPSTKQTLTTDQLGISDNSPNAFTGNGLMDAVQVNQAWLKYRTRFLTPVELTVGKQYFSRAQGLLVDNNQEPIEAFKIDWTSGNLCWGATWGMLQREEFFGRTAGSIGLPRLADSTGLYDPETSGQDNINIYSLDWAFTNNWKVGGTYLASGFNEEKGWSADLTGKALGIDWYGEWAQLLDWPTGHDFADFDGDDVQDVGEAPLSDSDTAWLAGLRWGNSFVNLTGEYGQVDAGYAFSIAGGGWSALNPFTTSSSLYTDYFNLPLSRLHPNAEIDPHDINWVDRPLFLDATNIARGWHVGVTFPTLLGGNTPLSVSYATGDGYHPDYIAWLLSGGSSTTLAAPDKWRDADPVWIVKLSRQFTENVSANLIYGRREVDNIMSPQEVEIPGTATFAENKAIQVIRAEVSVAF